MEMHLALSQQDVKAINIHHQCLKVQETKATAWEEQREDSPWEGTRVWKGGRHGHKCAYVRWCVSTRQAHMETGMCASHLASESCVICVYTRVHG